ncbi:MAG TPA: Uma2 family endonuclease [Vicinamibacteria bacterium]|nr:Uma2 family endonuclease [Vicinamibacteria bacterium]
MSGTTTPTGAKPITGEELALLPDVGPCELVEGRIVPMSPAGGEHGRIEFNFGEAIAAFARSRKLGRVLVGEVGIFTHRAPDTVRGADLAYLSNETYARLGSKRGFLDVAPDLVVEVLSPRDSAAGLTRKLREYFAIGVRLVWVADPDARAVLAYRSLTDVREFRENDRLSGDDVLPGFEVPVASLFEE